MRGMAFTVQEGCNFSCKDKQQRVPSCGGRSSCTETTCGCQASLRGGWRSLLPCLRCQRFWCADFAQKHTDQTRWTGHLCCLRLPSLTLPSPLNEPRLSTVSVESCGQTAPWEPSGSGWRSSPEFWAERRNKKTIM